VPTKERRRGWPLGRWAAAVAIAGGVLLLTVLAFQFRGSAHPAEYCGDWLIVGSQGDDRGTITLSRTGGLDARDTYVGRWTHEDGRLQLEFWEAPETLAGYLLTDRQRFTFIPKFDNHNQPASLHGQNVTLIRQQNAD